MAASKVEQRLMALEEEVARLKTELEKLAKPFDWRQALGMFTGDEGMREIFEEGQKIREADRQKTFRELDEQEAKEKTRAKQRARKKAKV
jgi:hypothetical protein